MAESATDTITIAAPPETVWSIAADVERYPDWAKDVKAVIVRARDEQGRPAKVEYRASALGRSDVGQVKAGAFGDLIGVSGDPLKDITLLEHPVFVMKGGAPIKQPARP